MVPAPPPSAGSCSSPACGADGWRASLALLCRLPGRSSDGGARRFFFTAPLADAPRAASACAAEEPVGGGALGSAHTRHGTALRVRGLCLGSTRRHAPDNARAARGMHAWQACACGRARGPTLAADAQASVPNSCSMVPYTWLAAVYAPCPRACLILGIEGGSPRPCGPYHATDATQYKSIRGIHAFSLGWLRFAFADGMHGAMVMKPGPASEHVIAPYSISIAEVCHPQTQHN